MLVTRKESRTESCGYNYILAILGSCKLSIAVAVQGYAWYVRCTENQQGVYSRSPEKSREVTNNPPQKWLQLSLDMGNSGWEIKQEEEASPLPTVTTVKTR